jgi:hypothetical protein
MISPPSRGPGRGHRHTAATDAADWMLLLDAARPNGLIVGPAPVAGSFLHDLTPMLRKAVVDWPIETSPSRAHGQVPIGTLIIRDVGSLDRRAQQSLLQWMNDAGRAVQVIALASAAVYPLVLRDAFASALYYRLNEVYIQCDAGGGHTPLSLA